MSTSNERPWHKTACIICSLNCGVEVQTDGGRITRIRGDDDHPVSKGYVCEKSQRLDYYQNGADRLDSPMRRKPDGSYEAIDWDTAIREIAGKFTAIKERHGGESILYYGGAKKKETPRECPGFSAEALAPARPRDGGRLYDARVVLPLRPL